MDKDLSTGWTKKSKGNAIIMYNPSITRAIVIHKTGLKAGQITFNGKNFDSVAKAKAYAESKITGCVLV